MRIQASRSQFARSNAALRKVRRRWSAKWWRLLATDEALSPKEKTKLVDWLAGKALKHGVYANSTAMSDVLFSIVRLAFRHWLKNCPEEHLGQRHWEWSHFCKTKGYSPYSRCFHTPDNPPGQRWTAIRKKAAGDLR